MTDGNHEGVVRRIFGDTLDEVFFGQALYFSSLPDREVEVGTTGRTGFALAQFRTNSNQTQLSVYLGTDGAIQVFRHGVPDFPFADFDGTLLYRSAPIVGAGAYQHFEHYLKVHDTLGAYELRVDEVTVVNLTGIDTDHYGVGEVSQVAVGLSFDDGNGGAFAGSATVDMADCYVNDTDSDGSACDTFVGDCKSAWFSVNADTAQADFTKSTGSVGYSLLNEEPANDADFITTASTTARSDFGLENGASNMSEILTVRPAVRAMKDDAGTASIAPSMESGGTKATVTDQPITTAFAYYDRNVPLDPDTGVPWTPAGYNASEEVVERTA
jgi:hypothetical protein